MSGLAYKPVSQDMAYGGILNALATNNHLYIEQKIRWIEAITDGCCEQNNKYVVYNEEGGQVLFGVMEDSDCCNRCFCAPDHTFDLHMIGAENGQINWKEASWTGPTLLHREGCCSKCLSCFSCNESCQHVGDVFPDAQESIQRFRMEEKLCNGCTPEIVIYAVGGANDGSDWPMAVLSGPCMFGGCMELCSDFYYDVSTCDDSADLSTKEENMGNIATIRKIKPDGCCALCLECCTDIDRFSVNFQEGFAYNNDPNFKTCVLSSLFYLDFMFFEMDNGICGTNSSGDLVITFFNCYCSGCICPCCITCPRSEG